MDKRIKSQIEKRKGKGMESVAPVITSRKESGESVVWYKVRNKRMCGVRESMCWGIKYDGGRWIMMRVDVQDFAQRRRRFRGCSVGGGGGGGSNAGHSTGDVPDAVLRPGTYEALSKMGVT